MSNLSFGTNQTNLGLNFGQNKTSAFSAGGSGFNSLTTTTPSFGTSSLFTFSTSTANTGNTFNVTTAPSFSLNTFPPFGGTSANVTTSNSNLLNFQPSNMLSSFGNSSLFNKPSLSIGSSGATNFQAPSQNQPAIQNQQLVVFSPKIYNDEKDSIIGMFNSIQAFWGTGKGYYSSSQNPYEFNESDPFNRFKTICYSDFNSNQTVNDEKVFFLIKFDRTESELKTNLLSYEQNFKVLIPDNTFTVKLDLKNILPDSKALISISVTENSTQRIVPDAQLRTYLDQPLSKQQLNNIFVGCFIDVIFYSLSKQEIEAYLNTPPKGIDGRLWTQAKLENPDSNRFIPLPLIGFTALNNRFKLQEKEIQQQQMRMKQAIDDVTALESDISQFKAKFEECRRKHAILTYRVLKKMIHQEVQRKRTLPIQAEEDKLRASLEAIQSELNVPTKFQGCLNELMSQLRQMQSQNYFQTSIAFDDSVFNDYKKFLKEKNDGIMTLVELLKKDIEDLNKLSAK